MTNEGNESMEMDDLESQLLEMPPGPDRDELLLQLPESLRLELANVLMAGDLAWESQFVAPPLQDDPIAAALGLLVDPSHIVSARALGNARKASRLTVGNLAEQLTRRGWQTRSRDVFNWERNDTPLAPAVLRAIASIVNASPESLLTSPTSPFSVAASDVGHARAAAEAERSPRFMQLVARYAGLTGQSVRDSRDAMSGRLLATVHRGSHPDPDQMLDNLEALVKALETRGPGGHEGDRNV